jgi:bacterial/archaeal transporter family protein
MRIPPWLFYALLSALAASFVAIFGKVGMRDVDSNLATTVRSIVMTLFLLAVCAFMGLFSKLSTLSPRPLIMITLSGLAGALSWLFYFRAIQLGSIFQVAPIDKLSMPLAVVLAVLLLQERPTSLNWLGIAMIAAGAYLAAIPRPG